MTLHVQHGLLLIMKIYLVEIYEQAVTGFTTYKHELFSCLQNFHDIIVKKKWFANYTNEI